MFNTKRDMFGWVIKTKREGWGEGLLKGRDRESKRNLIYKILI